MKPQRTRLILDLAPRWAVPLGAAACLLLLGGCPDGDDAGPINVVVSDEGDGSDQMSREDIIKAARIDGELHWYTSARDEEANAFLEAFKKQYPFINTHLRRSSTFDIISQVNEEIESGEVRADVLHVLDVGVFIELRGRGELLRYPSPEASAIDERFREPGYWWAMRLVAMGMAYNRNVLPPDRAPTGWEDLLRPELKGKIGFKDAATAGTAYAEYFLLRERFGTLFWERIAAQQPRIKRSAGEVKADLLSGDILVAGEMAGYTILSARNAGEPIEAVWPEEGVPFIPGPVGILARSEHPNAAKLFVDFALSREGQEFFRELVGAYSARTDVEPLEGQPALESLNLLTPTSGWGDYLQKQNALRAEFEKLFRPGGE